MLRAPATQQAFGDLVGISQAAVADLVRRGVLRPGDLLAEWVHSYCGHLRAMAAGRVEAPGVTAERERLLRAKADAAVRENAIACRELVHAHAIRRESARVATIVIGLWDAAARQFAEKATVRGLAFEAALRDADAVVRAVRTQVADAIARNPVTGEPLVLEDEE